MNMEYSTFLRKICESAQFAILIPLVLSLMNLKKLTNVFKAVLLTLIVLTIVDFIGFHLYINGENNIHLLHLYILIETCCWVFIYIQLLKEQYFHRVVLLGMVVIFLSVFWITNGSWDLIYEVSNTDRMLSSLIFLYCSIAWFALMLKTKLDTKHDDLFWLNAGIFAHGFNNFAFTLIFMLFLQSPNAPMLEIWTLYNIFVIVYYSLIAVAIWKHSKVPIFG